MRRVLFMLLCGLAVTAPVAAAQDDEVFVDPGSPSGKEYALPLDQARKQSASTPKRASSATGKAPLFGEGVGEDSAATRVREPRGAPPRAAGAATREPAARPGAAAGRLAEASAPGASNIGVVVGVGAGVLLLGVLLGLLLRRRAAR